ncbi:MAG TPA: hypothetical protein VFC65_13695 [Prolixibacteraceae bacterium]|nr:hypothetical protein [Prolixibacteraceae bacterium]
MRNYLLAVLFIGLFIGQVNAQDQNGKSADLGSMSKEFLNPLSDIWSIQIQNDFVFVAGDYISGNRKANFTNFQPIMPIPLGEKWNLVNRPLIPYVVVETPQLNGSYKNESGLGDIELIQVVSPAKGLGFFNMFGVGATWIFPTAKNDAIGAEQWSVGPTLGIGRISEKFVFGIIAQQNWSLGGKENRPDINRFKFQYFLKYRINPTFNITSSPIIIANWDKNSNNKWSIPLGLGFSSTMKIGILPVNLSYETQYYVESPESYGAQWNFRFTLTTGIMNPFKK